MYEFWYDYVKLKYGENAKLCYVYTDSFSVHVKMNDIYKNIAEDVETRFDNSHYELDRPLPKWKNKKVIGLMKDKLGGQIMKEFVGLREKAYIYFKGNSDEDKYAKSKKMCVTKANLNFKVIKTV